MKINVYSVRQINAYIKATLDEDLALAGIGVTGEISNFKKHPSGHLYFTLRDEYAAIRCVMFKSAAVPLGFAPSDGMKVIAAGRVSLYEKSGDFQLYVESMEKCGTGSLFLNFEMLKRKLSEEGLFDADRKKAIPPYVKSVAVITSKSGAALRDIIQIIGRRNKGIKITVVPAAVQGEGAAKEIARSIEAVNIWGKADCLIVGRGGGSFEDLQPFNEEITARAIAASKIPVISAVGHETDFTIADFAADLRAPTPSAAAEIVSFDLNAANAAVNTMLKKITGTLTKRIKQCAARVSALKNRRALKAPAQYIFEKSEYIQACRRRAASAASGLVSRLKTRVNYNVQAADNLSPLRVISRGYALVSDTDGAYICGIDGMPQTIGITMKDGAAKAVVTEKFKGEGGFCWQSGK